MKISKECQDCIQWWIDNLNLCYKPILIKSPDRKIELDSSMIGYGAHDVTNTKNSGVWSVEEKENHINFLELKAAFLALKAFCNGANDEHIQLYLDNTTAIKYLNKMGGRKKLLNKLAKDIWLWCIERNIWLSAFFIKGTSNLTADALSRFKLNADMEWMVSKDIFDKIMLKFGPCDIDFFASKYTIDLKTMYLLDQM